MVLLIVKVLILIVFDCDVEKYGVFVVVWSGNVV